ncbi:MAG: amidohydrolase [Clostridia bacterium]|nr:amidohydrolase [Clostridia bacterium]
MLTNEIRALAESWEQMAIDIRHMLHRIPELQYNEFKTSGYICSVLDTLSIPYKKGYGGGTGIVAEICGTGDGKCVALRADIDALPICEETNLPYKSEHEGLMHGCGHDAHMAIALYTAFILNELRDSFKGSVKFLFQPAEEGDGGAEIMIEEGVLENPSVDICIGGHVMSEYETGTIVYKNGSLMSSPDNFEVVIKGTGGHGAYPERCVNPIVVASEVISSLTSLTDTNVPRVVSVCTVEGGSCPNVIPSTVKLTGTARTFTRQSRDEVERLIEERVREVTDKYLCGYNYKYIPLYPALINDDEVTERFCESAAKIVGEEMIVPTHQVSMAGDDFSYFAAAVPSTYVHIGCRSGETDEIIPIHNPKFTVDDACLSVAAMCYSQFIVDYLTRE